MKLLIAGGTGFIGQHAIHHLQKNHQITVLTRDVKKAKALLPKINAISWQDNTLKSVMGNMDAVINLVGENIGEKRWSQSVKETILNSRSHTTAMLCSLIIELTKHDRPRLLNASAIGVYGLQPDITSQNNHTYEENSALPNPPSDFLSEVGQAWEKPLMEASELDVVIMRFGVVLHSSGGMLKKVSLPFKLGFGGRIGSGEQPFSWIALDDVVALIANLLDNPEQTGVFNFVAPEVVTQQVFARTFAAFLNRPCFIPMPAFIVKLLFGQMGNELLLQGQSVRTERLKDFPFKYPSLEKALSHRQ